MFEMGPSIIRMFIFWGGVALFLAIELAAPYRRPSVSKLKRWANNMSLTVINSVILNLIFAGAVVATANHVTANHIGVMNLFEAPRWLKIVLTVAFFDFLLYVWHLLNHEMPLLWRFHRVHHTDLNMDVSTATRFHLGELMISATIKLGLIYLWGAEVLAVVIFETLLVFCAQFHHSSLKIPAWVERIIGPVTITPSMHRIHHSVKIKERNTNYGTIFSWWDRAMGTLLTKVKQDGIRIGVGGHYEESKLNLPNLALMPFTKYVP